MKHVQADIELAREPQSRKKRRSPGILRAARYYSLKILRIRATPHAISIGVAAGVFAAFLPLVGVHIAISIAVAWLLGVNMIAAAASTVLVGNPLTYPFIWAATWEAGQLILGSGPRGFTRFNLHDLFHNMTFMDIWRPILKPMLIGSLPIATVCAVIGYVVVYQAVKIFRARRQARLMAR